MLAEGVPGYRRSGNARRFFCGTARAVQRRMRAVCCKGATALKHGAKMTTNSARLPPDVEALSTLSEYLERALDKALSLIMLRTGVEDARLYLGDVSAPKEEWASCGTIHRELSDAILVATQSGLNHLSIDGQTYRFTRVFAQAENRGAIVFTPA